MTLKHILGLILLSTPFIAAFIFGSIYLGKWTLTIIFMIAASVVLVSYAGVSLLS